MTKISYAREYALKNLYLTGELSRLQVRSRWALEKAGLIKMLPHVPHLSRPLYVLTDAGFAWVEANCDLSMDSVMVRHAYATNAKSFVWFFTA